MKIYQTQRGLPKPLPKAGKKRTLYTENTGIKLPTGENSYTPPPDSMPCFGWEDSFHNSLGKDKKE